MAPLTWTHAVQAPATVKLVGSNQDSPLFVLGKFRPFMCPRPCQRHAACTALLSSSCENEHLVCNVGHRQ